MDRDKKHGWTGARKGNASHCGDTDSGVLSYGGVWCVRDKTGFEWKKLIGAAIAIAGIVVFRW